MAAHMVFSEEFQESSIYKKNFWKLSSSIRDLLLVLLNSRAIPQSTETSANLLWLTHSISSHISASFQVSSRFCYLIEAANADCLFLAQTYSLELYKPVSSCLWGNFIWIFYRYLNLIMFKPELTIFSPSSRLINEIIHSFVHSW